MDDGLLAGSPEKERASMNASHQRAVGPGWRRPDWGANGEVKEGGEGWRGTQRLVRSSLSDSLSSSLA